MTVAQMGREMSAREFLEWSLYDRVKDAEIEAAQAEARARAERG